MKNKIKANGDCYVANGRFIISSSKKYMLCHGVAILKTDGLPFGHCWLECEDYVIDKSNGLDIKLPIDYYYSMGNIPVAGYKIYKYSRMEVIKKVIDFGHWGAWDYDPPI